MDDRRENSNSFVLSNNTSNKSNYLFFGMMLLLMSFNVTSMFITIHIVLKIISLTIFLVLAMFRILEIFRRTNMIIEDNKLIIGIDEIKGSEIEEIIYNSWMTYIKRKNRGLLRKYVTVSLKDNKELVRLKSKLSEFGNKNEIRIRTMNE